jgi:cytochrome c biogenesis protein CcmG/thiol:disulfide interchange protein DsbE
MTSSRRWTLVTGSALAVVFVVALVIRILPEIRLVGVGATAPTFDALNLRTGLPSGLADYQGRVILLNIWATWCQPCRVEMPALERLARKLAATDFRVVAVSVDVSDSSTVMGFVRDLDLSFDILQDPTRRIERRYRTTGVPESFVIDRHGVIVKKVIGAVSWDSPVNENLIRRLIDER